MKKNMTNSKGFTLIELLIVVAIIAILAAIAVPNFLEAQTRSKISRARADMRTYATAIESYRVDSNQYPWTYNGISCPGPVPPNDCDGFGEIRSFGFLTVPNPITTPIAYISSHIPDVFKIGQTVDAGPNTGESWDEGNDRDRTFMYLNMRQGGGLGLDPGNPGEITDTSVAAFTFFGSRAEWLETFNDWGEWQIRSIGPTASYSGPNGVAYTSIDSQYDASNGTLSFGHVIRNQNSPDGQQNS